MGLKLKKSVQFMQESMSDRQRRMEQTQHDSADSTALFLTLVHLIAKEVDHDSCSFFNPHKTKAAERRLPPKYLLSLGYCGESARRLSC